MNSAYRTGRGGIYLSNDAREWKELVAWTAKNQWKGEPLKTSVVLSIRFFFGSKRKRDLDNGIKNMADSLQGICYLNDNQIYELRAVKFYDKLLPRVEIDIDEYLN